MEEVKLYFDFKSPFAYLAKDQAFELSRRFDVAVRWIPFILRIKGKGERSVYSEYESRSSSLDARRVANRRGGFPVKGPLKVDDSEPALAVEVDVSVFDQRGAARPVPEPRSKKES